LKEEEKEVDEEKCRVRDSFLQWKIKSNKGGRRGNAKRKWKNIEQEELSNKQRSMYLQLHKLTDQDRPNRLRGLK